MMFAQTTVEAPKYGASSREAEISVASVPAPTRNATTPRRRPPLPKELALVLRLVFGGGVARLFRRDRHLLGRDLARDDGDVDLVLVLAVDQNRRAGAELTAEHEVRQRVLDEALDRTPQRASAHRRVVALVDEQLLGA